MQVNMIGGKVFFFFFLQCDEAEVSEIVEVGCFYMNEMSSNEMAYILMGEYGTLASVWIGFSLY